MAMITGYHTEWNIESKTIVIGRVGFYCGCVHIVEQKSWVTDNALIVRFNNQNIDIYFLAFLLKYSNLGEFDNSTAQPVISGQKIYSKIIPIPPLAEQKRIVEKVDKLLELCGLLK
jgi:type I restriction enzyme S subunit